jgi:hypothetical protein
VREERHRLRAAGRDSAQHLLLMRGAAGMRHRELVAQSGGLDGESRQQLGSMQGHVGVRPGEGKKRGAATGPSTRMT